MQSITKGIKIFAISISAIGLCYSTILYGNKMIACFAFTVKKDDPPLELPTIKVPGSLSEAWELASNFGKSVAGPQEEVIIDDDHDECQCPCKNASIEEPVS